MNRPVSSLHGRVAIVGAGVAGLMTALRLAPRPVVLLSRASLGDGTSSAWAQGGLAASLGVDDSPALHLEDTLAAGDGLCDARVVEEFVRAAPSAIEDLAKFDVRFDRTREGAFRLGLEAAHCRRRIVHAAGDSTGRELMRALVAAARRAPSVQILDGFEARRLLVDDNRVLGVVAIGGAGSLALETDKVVIATGGIGGLFLESTNPLGSFGQGLALAARAGAELANLEFIQFHPTAFDGPARPMPLVSEAVRGEGAILVDETGRRFLADQPGAELAARDIVARAIWRHIGEGHRVFLDARAALGVSFARRFPSIDSACRLAGVDPATMPIPVRPAAHYHMGGIAVNANGRSSVEGLWSCGEAACSGLHGANRLASNSLTEAAVSAEAVARDVGGALSARARPTRCVYAAPTPDASLVRPVLSRSAGVLREGGALRKAASELLPLALGGGRAADPAAIGLMIAIAALRREESRGAHWRTDFPEKYALALASRWTLDQAIAAARELAPMLMTRSA